MAGCQGRREHRCWRAGKGYMNLPHGAWTRGWGVAWATLNFPPTENRADSWALLQLGPRHRRTSVVAHEQWFQDDQRDRKKLGGDYCWEVMLAGPRQGGGNWGEGVEGKDEGRGHLLFLLPPHTPANMVSHWIYPHVQIPCFDFHLNPRILIKYFQIL